ncbi:hypothetical protein ACN27G_06100 [Plantactinospora sp. WMMB334]|uniref:hypothetical protein n=1 Tax=Plantactinospora sp. WMMB334 TaxID=3404119 RepID=UPI003B93A9A0
MKGRDLARLRGDLRARQLADPEAATRRAHRGADLCRAALRGEQLPDEQLPDEPAVPAAPPAPPPRMEWVSCARCYAPHEGLPNTLCPACSAPQAQALDDLVTGGGTDA